MTENTSRIEKAPINRSAAQRINMYMKVAYIKWRIAQIKGLFLSVIPFVDSEELRYIEQQHYRNVYYFIWLLRDLAAGYPHSDDDWDYSTIIRKFCKLKPVSEPCDYGDKCPALQFGMCSGRQLASNGIVYVCSQHKLKIKEILHDSVYKYPEKIEALMRYILRAKPPRF